MTHPQNRFYRFSFICSFEPKFSVNCPPNSDKIWIIYLYHIILKLILQLLSAWFRFLTMSCLLLKLSFRLAKTIYKFFFNDSRAVFNTVYWLAAINWYTILKLSLIISRWQKNISTGLGNFSIPAFSYQRVLKSF